MNPTSQPSGNLDPKLKAAYDRVMSAPSPTATPFSAPSEAESAKAPSSSPLPPPPGSFNTSHVMNTPLPSVKPTKMVVTADTEGGLDTKQIVYILLGVVLLAGYTIFWMWYFNIVQLPF